MRTTVLSGHLRIALACWLSAPVWAWVLPLTPVMAQEAMLEFPIRPFNVDVMLRQQTFAPDDREIGVQLGLQPYATAISRFGPFISSSASIPGVQYRPAFAIRQSSLE
ncbi:MAG: hypothetical protein QM771_17650 [Nitrospira sp.]